MPKVTRPDGDSRLTNADKARNTQNAVNSFRKKTGSNRITDADMKRIKKK